ncbi:MAG TPA: lysophospholipid acyltransferase family protein, partial [Atopobiaceae bacterium]|nr:lysophospholipid acyltransferase family protein [Atopobiaceae bacterium]
MRGISVRPIFKSEFNLNTLTTWFFSRVGGIPVNRGTADMKAVRRAKAALERGENILIFPEGTRIKSDDEPAKIHGGFALMAQLAKAPVVPVAIVGARDLRPKG